MNNILILIYIYIYFFSTKKVNKFTLDLIINNKLYNYIIKRNYIKILKYNYIFYYLLFELFKLNFQEFNLNNKYFKKFNNKNLNNLIIKFKDNKLLIYLESYKNNLLIHNYKNNYFYKDKKIKIYLYKNFILKIEIVIFLIYKDYIE